MKKQSFVLFLWVLLFFLNGCSQQKLTIPLIIDFGDIEYTDSNIKVISTGSDDYSSKKGYGFLSDEIQSIYQDSSYLNNALTLDGVESEKHLQFKLDIPNGHYFIELLLPEGKFSDWTGSIKINNSLLKGKLEQYRKSSEGEDPPDHWMLLSYIEVEDNGVLIEIDADNQASGLCALCIFPESIGSIQLSANTLSYTGAKSVPNIDLILKLLNQGKIDETYRLIDAIPDEGNLPEKAELIIALAGRLETEHPRPYIEWALGLFKKYYSESLDSNVLFNIFLAKRYIQADMYYKMQGWDWSKKLTQKSIFPRMDIAGRYFDEILAVPEHPLHNRAKYELAKLTFHAWLEEHKDNNKVISENYTQELLNYYPDHKLLNIYSNSPVDESDESTFSYDSSIPDWAKTSHQALKATVDLIHYWVDNRQAENGEFGGKFDDDVEMLRWWPISRLAADDSLALAGMKKLVNGIWESDWIYKGFSRKLRDVEHSSEPVADTQPMMIGLDFGNPVFIERCMMSLTGAYDVWTGINEQGHRHFKSAWYSATAIDTEAPKDCDVGMNARTVKAIRWLAWYNQHPKAIQFLKEWGDAWLEDSKRTDRGKPYGIIPPAIRYSDDAISPYGEAWYDANMFWHYFNFRTSSRMMQQFLSTYTLTGDKKYLEPITIAMDLVRKYKNSNNKNYPDGGEEWVANKLKNSDNFAETIQTWRLITGDSSYDDIIMSSGSNYIKYRLSGDKAYITKGNERIINGIELDKSLIRSEGYFTDRIEVGNVHESEAWQTSHLESSYLGNVLLETFHPFYQISWKGFKDFSALVKSSSKTRCDILLYNLTEKAQSGDIFLWFLEPGEYELTMGPDKNHNDSYDKITFRKQFTIKDRYTDIALEIPPMETQVLSVRQKKAYKNKLAGLADLAITEDELSVVKNSDGYRISIPVHNIGVETAGKFTVELKAKGQLIENIDINELEAPLDLKPKVVMLAFNIDSSIFDKGNISLSIDSHNDIREITEINNSIIIEK